MTELSGCIELSHPRQLGPHKLLLYNRSYLINIQILCVHLFTIDLLGRNVTIIVYIYSKHVLLCVSCVHILNTVNIALNHNDE